ncbi:spore-associated protein A [Actinoallomurus iriomotensis]|uniref:Acetyltransferase n=1 Tax=Actinoallomurus iriomotensis TaxID=478107 RepID=A0A9W6RQ16_9ACTN|nr:spore-associated protein A [Actinoallomurus iriomotensis]GLY79759.1 hypothetical protein Airi01_080260 [Actinoallomurus iriomotensis]
MHKVVKKVALSVSAAVALAVPLSVNNPAMAASSPIAACGGGSYHVIDKHDLGPAVIYLLYNGTTNCVVTWKDSPNTTSVYASIQRQSDGKEVQDVGHYSTYAGPVKLNAAGTCVWWMGGYGNSYEWGSGWSHCG